MNENEISEIIVDCFFKIHNQLEPGLLDSVYEEVLAYELLKRRLNIERQKGIPVIYENLKLELGFKTDIIVENKVIIELKSIDATLLFIQNSF